MKQAYLADEIFTGTNTFSGKVLLTENNRITGIQSAGDLPPGFEILQFPGCMIAPAFIDLQIYGGNGKLFSIPWMQNPWKLPGLIVLRAGVHIL